MRSRTAGGGVKWGVAASDVLPAWVADMDLGIPPARRRAVSTGSRGDAGVTPGVCHARAGTDPRHPRREVDVPTLASAESLSLIHISEPTRLGMISYAVF